MPAYQGVVAFGNISHCTRFQMTMANGISPSVATLTVPAGSIAIPPKFSDLGFSYGPVSFRLYRCLLDSIQETVDGEGRQFWNLRIFDRRWLWREASLRPLSGFYNVRIGVEKDHIIPSSERNPHDLARLCLDAMGERGYDVSALPRDARPMIEWDYTNPAIALAELCDDLGCTISLGLDNQVRIHPMGKGAKLPNGGITSDVELDPPDVPGKFVIVGDRDRWQTDLTLEAVGLDTDNLIKLIDELSYIPTVDGLKTWAHADIDEFNEDSIKTRKARELAKQTVFRWYRIKQPLRMSNGYEVKERWRILPLHNEQVEKWEVPKTTGGDSEPTEVPRPPWVYGSFWEGLESPAPAAEDPEPDIPNTPRGLYRGGFTLDTNLGIVKFIQPVYQFDASPLGGLITPAELKLRVAVSLRDEKTRGWQRYEYERKPSGRSGGDLATMKKIIRHDDIRFSHYHSFEGVKGPRDNRAECDRQAEYYLAAEEQKYQLLDSGSVDYVGFVPLSCDGAIQQVTWSITDEGWALCRISRNKEESTIILPYKERRLYEKLLAARQADKPTRARRDDERLGGR